MTSIDLDTIIDALRQGEESSRPALVFERMSEVDVWKHSDELVKRPETALLLVQAIDSGLPRLANQDQAGEILRTILAQSTDSLIFLEARNSILQHASTWDLQSALKFYECFAQSYRQNKTVGDAFVGECALEGAVMLPLYRADDNLLTTALGLLLNYFPEIPQTSYSPSYMAVKAVKLLSRCYDRLPNFKPIYEKVQELLGVINRPVHAEANVAMGIIHLYEAFGAQEQQSFIRSLTSSADCFRVAISAEENRTDAELLANIVKCLQAFALDISPEKVKASIERIEDLVIERTYNFGGATSSMAMPEDDLEGELAYLIAQLEKWSHEIGNAIEWIDYLPPIYELAKVYTFVRSMEASEGIKGNVGKSITSTILLPQIRGKFSLIQAVTQKLEKARKQVSSTGETPDYLIDFYELVLREVEEPNRPKSDAIAGLNVLRAMAENDPEFAEKLEQHMTSGKNAEELYLELARWVLDRQARNDEDWDIPPPVLPTFRRIRDELMDKMKSRLDGNLWFAVVTALRSALKYHFELFAVDAHKARGDDIRFLFAKDSSRHGLGADAKEGDLQEHLRRSASIAPGFPVIDIESSFQVPGRADLVFVIRGVRVPIEVKAERDNIDRTNIRAKWLGQAQSYAMGGISFLLVLDVTKKYPKFDLMNPGDYCYVDRHPVAGATLEDIVVVLIFPANRYLPNERSKSIAQEAKSYGDQ
jgi:hypothetical protein